MSWSNEDKQWLSNLKVGDNFKVTTRHGGRGYDVYKIRRETNTRFFFWRNKETGYEGSFRKSDGLVIGENDGGRFYQHRYVQKITEVDLAAQYKRTLVKYMKDKNWEKFSADHLKQVYDLMEMIEHEHLEEKEGEPK